MKKIIALVIVIVVVLFAASTTVFVVDQRHMGVLSSRDGGSPTLLGPGLHVRLPAPLQSLMLVDNRIQSVDAPDEDRYATSDKNELLANPVIRYRVSDPVKLFTAMKGEPQSLPDRLALLARTALTDSFARHTLSDVLAKQQTVADEARAAMATGAASLGVTVVDVQLTRIDFPAEMADTVYKRMIAAREQSANDERAKGQSEADQIRAAAQEQQQKVTADAFSKAQAIKGEGDAKAAQIAGDAFAADPQFYQFYQSMQAYRNTFKPGDVIVVDPSSDFFRFMRGPNGGAGAGAGTADSDASRKH